MGRLNWITYDTGPYKEKTRVIGRKRLLVVNMKGPQAKECRTLPKLEMTKKWILPCSLQKECSSASTLILAQLD